MEFTPDIKFLLFSGESDGCFVCSVCIGLEVKLYNNIEEVVNIFHDMMERKIKNDYPIRLLSIDEYDGEILEDLDLSRVAGCLSNLTAVKFKLNKIIYKVIRGKRQVN